MIIKLIGICMILNHHGGLDTTSGLSFISCLSKGFSASLGRTPSYLYISPWVSSLLEEERTGMVHSERKLVMDKCGFLQAHQAIVVTVGTGGIGMSYGGTAL